MSSGEEMTPLTKQILARCEFDLATYTVHSGDLEQLSRGRRIGARDAHHRLTPTIEALCAANDKFVAALKEEYPCDEHVFEPNTTMDYFRCDKCGIRPKLAEVITENEAAMRRIAGEGK